MWAGCWVFGQSPPSLFMWQQKRPPWIQRFLMRKLLGIGWVDANLIPSPPPTQATDLQPPPIPNMKMPNIIQ